MNAPLVRDQSTEAVEKINTTGLISVSEIFGPTIQGEGALIGMPTVFVRTGGCDYRCRWCDTAYAVLPEFQQDWQWMDSKTVLQEVIRLSQGQPLWVTLSGGNPALQELVDLIRLGKKQGYRFSMETQGSVAKPWFALLDQLTLSPKPPSSGMCFKAKGLQRCLQACQGDAKHKVDVSLKFVIADQQDLRWAKHIADQYPQLPCFVQPCNTRASLEDVPDNKHSLLHADQQKPLLDLIAATQAMNWYNVRILPQLHTWLWGDTPGV